MADYMLVTHAIQIELNITPTAQAPTWAVFGNGIDNLTEALNETIQQYFFMSNKGFASNYVTGQAPAYTCTGRKIVGDPAQEWIFNPSRKFGLMAERDTQIRVSVPAANNLINQFTANVTIANVTDLGGATTDGSAVSFEIRINGKPVLATITPTSTLAVESAAGTAVGDTLLTVTPSVPAVGNKYVYKYGTEAPEATVGQALDTTGWNDFTNGQDYTIANGQKVTVAQVNLSTFIVTASGEATVVAKTA